MQDWDRLVMILVGAAVSIHTGIQGWKFWQEGNFLAVAGVAVLILAAVGMPVALVFFAS